MKKLFNRRMLRQHYTISEMIMVAGIFIIILSMAMAAWLNTGSEAKLKRAVRMVNDQLNLARSKAIAERTEIGVNFYFDANKNQKCGIYYYDGSNRQEAVPNEPELAFPAGTIATCTEPASYAVSPDTTFYYLVFNAKGQLCNWRYTVREGTDSDSNNEPLRAIWVTTAKKQKNNQLQVDADEAYYEIAINTFNGRTKTTYHEVNN